MFPFGPDELLGGGLAHGLGQSLAGQRVLGGQDAVVEGLPAGRHGEPEVRTLQRRRGRRREKARGHTHEGERGREEATANPKVTEIRSDRLVLNAAAVLDGADRAVLSVSLPASASLSSLLSFFLSLSGVVTCRRAQSREGGEGSKRAGALDRRSAGRTRFDRPTGGSEAGSHRSQRAPPFLVALAFQKSPGNLGRIVRIR